MKCPICDGSSDRVFEKHGYWILQCKQCHHRFCELLPSQEHISNVYSDQYFTGGGAGYSDYLAESKLLIRHGERYGDLLNKYTLPGNILDIGSAAGFILKGFENKGWVGQGVEPNSTMAQYARTYLGLNIEVGTLETLQTNKRFKLVTMVQVVAHFYEIRKALQAAADVTEPGGYWLIESWNKASWIARILGKNWYEYSPPSVLQWFSPVTLGLLAKQYGFKEVTNGRPTKWVDGSHTKSLLKYKLESSLLGKVFLGMANLIPDEVILPYPSYDLFWGLYQKSK